MGVPAQNSHRHLAGCTLQRLPLWNLRPSARHEEVHSATSTICIAQGIDYPKHPCRRVRSICHLEDSLKNYVKICQMTVMMVATNECIRWLEIFLESTFMLPCDMPSAWWKKHMKKSHLDTPIAPLFPWPRLHEHLSPEGGCKEANKQNTLCVKICRLSKMQFPTF